MCGRNVLVALLLFSSVALGQSFTIANLSLGNGAITKSSSYTSSLTASGTATLTPGGEATVTLKGTAASAHMCPGDNIIELELTFQLGGADSLSVLTALAAPSDVATFDLSGAFHVTGGTGAYSGKGGSGTVALTVNVIGNSFTTTGGGSGTLTAQLAPPPSIKPFGVVPIYSSVPIIQPGSWISIYGANLAPATTVWNGDFPITLGDVGVTIDGKPGFLWYASPGLINVQAPDSTNLESCVTVRVSTPTGVATSSVTLSEQQPSLIVQGDGRHIVGVIPVPDGSGAYGSGANSYDLMGPVGAFPYATRPVKRGEALVVYGVGWGRTKTSVPAGQVLSGANALVRPPILLLNGQFTPTGNTGINVKPDFAGLVAAGEYQMNFTIPPSAPSGDISIVVGFMQSTQRSGDNFATQQGLFITVQ
jgi:uncharacterized protein (TIGR03437 family)